MSGTYVIEGLSFQSCRALNVTCMRFVATLIDSLVRCIDLWCLFLANMGVLVFVS